MTRHQIQCRTHKYYWMSCDQYDALFEAASGRCQICGISGSDTQHGFLMIDHDYDVGEHGVRGLLCCSCNSRLRRGDLPFSEAAVRYLESPWWRIAGLEPLRSRRDLSAPERLTRDLR